MTEADRLVLFPAVDIVDGKAVRLHQGEAGTETDYGQPLENALKFQEAGAEWLHLVDLDAAFGRGDNRAIIKDLIASVDLKVELSGGIRDTAALEAALEIGAARVNIGTAAIENPEWTADIIRQHGDAVAVGLDVRGEMLAGRGWTKEGRSLWDVIDELQAAGCSRYVVTDINTDGTLSGPNAELLQKIASTTGTPVTASGGISSLDDLAALRKLVPTGVDSAIIGKALYAGRFTMSEALEVAGRP
ncbi:bifunctional 1-(5-phosphoribosyl)-5-((5-phosphoribosylamino)methylideneamino)imidazole-4-carboxamide isomerase/phosphoribosylanthranilate isomerase PriA [Brevibacterium ravenspurgense]|uniref:1-(5-phosphoribosyl)-5-[(5-phosphoribosylamino)methylideneamino] imidazole-4-carboxamide isomerase n=1 Tax=Brevibacterium ravenspurgense TaxID=479117 RepID=A0A2I1IE93_9MICO|nr:bifunctional 1-(5-phosphoribosyl)-5-((5-phosphoribosylamino)methylideneamino)imidazole-4-carboxamide isomerase/phosphoribosylanthranilate isomerase PriA [Brevibacterium ravenspurgense]PKY69452.1 bifunctional 1-(5-phosphoribosyl)-5-((5-phosphoribosylamino)methylideneamino)imidazole-4-carboxamide isomerase/phosphoribosylanthranilate isomerase PriA [Brevibacterium ravenspurgense]